MFYKAKSVIFMALAFALALANAGYSQQEQNKAEPQKPEIKRMFGTVAQVGFVKGFIMVTSEAGYVIVTVPEDIPISRGTKKIGLEEIDPGDSVIVQYYCPEPGKYVAVSIRDSTPPR